MNKETATSIIAQIEVNKKQQKDTEEMIAVLNRTLKEERKNLSDRHRIIAELKEAAKKKIRSEDELCAQLLRGGFCELCGSPAEEVHHIVEVSQQVRWGQRVPDNNLIPLCKKHHAMVHNKDPIYLKYNAKQATEWPEKTIPAVKLWLLQEVTIASSLDQALLLKEKFDIIRGVKPFISQLTFPLLVYQDKYLWMIRSKNSQAINLANGEKKQMHCFFSGGKFFAIKEGSQYFECCTDPNLSVDEWVTEEPVCWI